MRLIGILGGVLGIAALVYAAMMTLVTVEYAPFPSEADLENPGRRPSAAAYDVLGTKVMPAQAAQMRATTRGLDHLSRRNGAIEITPELVRMGREAFYKETFGNEWFLTDVMGLLDGAITPWAMTKAILANFANPTTDLKVRLAKDLRLGDQVLPAGTLVSTGLDIPAGQIMPMGIKMVWDKGALRAGITCAACHSTVDPATGRVVEGAPNPDFNVGFMLAASSNTAAYFTHVTVEDPAAFVGPDAPRIATASGGTVAVPDKELLETAVDAQFAAWPPGSFDSTVDMVSNPTSIPDSFTAEAHPFGWSGFAQIGPFRGSTMLSNNVHAVNADATTVAGAASELLGMDTELYLATMLQGAPNPAFRWDPGSGRAPSEVLEQANPTPISPSLVSAAVMPSWPNVTYISTDSLQLSTPGLPVWEKVNAISAFQDTLTAPVPRLNASSVRRGQGVFSRAGCADCHVGPALTNNRVLPVAEVGTQPSRARALAATEKALVPSVMIAPSTPFPPPAEPDLIKIQIPPDRLEQLQLGWAHAGTDGGYKVKGLVGLAVSAPYLHDHGVAVGPDAATQAGLPGTLYAGVLPDPVNSLRAMVDRNLRARVVSANREDARAAMSNVSGEGHEFWVDAEAGFTAQDQADLISFLLSIERAAGP